MTAEQGVQIFKSVQLQMSAPEQEKFNELILERVEQRESKIQKMIARLDKKYPNKKKNR